MCEVLGVVNIGIDERKSTTAIKTLSRYIKCQFSIDSQVLEDIANDNDFTVEKVRYIAKENSISLSC